MTHLRSGDSTDSITRLAPLVISLVLSMVIADAQEADDTVVGAENGVDEVMSMDLEELLNLRLSATNVLGIHHTHPQAEWMFGCRYMLMGMGGKP